MELEMIGGNSSPYAPVEISPLYDAEGKKINRNQIRIAQDTWDKEDRIYKQVMKQVGVVSDNYLLVSNEDVAKTAEEIISAANGNFYFEPKRVFFNGKQFSYEFVSEITKEPREGDPFAMGLMFTNSYDGSTRFGFQMYVLRLACSNGMISRSFLSRYSFKHTLGSENWNNELARTLDTINMMPEKLDSFVSQVALLDQPITNSQLHTLRKRIAAFPDSKWGRAIDNFLETKDYTQYGMMNALTDVVWHDEKFSASSYKHITEVTDASLALVA